MRSMIGLAAVFALSLAASPQGYVGTGALFSVGGGAWASGMAGAGLALAEGPEALFLNPAGLGWASGWEVLSTYANQFGKANVSAVCLAGAGLGLGGVTLNTGPITDDLSYRVEGATLGMGIPLFGGLALGGRLRVLHHVLPEEATGWAGDLAILWRGQISLGMVFKGVISREVFPGEAWPRAFSLGMALPLPLSTPFSGNIACAVTGLGEDSPVVRIGLEVWAGGLGVRGGFTGDALAFGLSVHWGVFWLDWATMIHPVLPTSLRVSLRVTF